MIRELFVNTCILISFIFIVSQVFKNTGMNQNSSLKLKLMLGGFSGALGIILMLFSIHINGTVIMDLRYVVILLAAVLGGMVSSLLSASIIAIFRVIYFGLSYSSLVAAGGVIILALGASFICRYKISEIRKWIFMYLYSIAVISAVFPLVVSDKRVLSNVLFNYFLAEGFATVTTCYVTNYLAASNKIYRRLKEESTKDFLTGLNNVRSFDIEFNKAIENTRNKCERLGILMVDIDFFKKVNDTYGHAAGDAVLRQLGEVMVKSSRSFDVVSRMGGEEFSVIMPDSTRQQGYEVGEKIRCSVESTSFVLPDGTSINITVSVGVAIYPDMVEDLDQIVKAADSALYEAKHSGRNKVC